VETECIAFISDSTHFHTGHDWFTHRQDSSSQGGPGEESPVSKTFMPLCFWYQGLETSGRKAGCGREKRERKRGRARERSQGRENKCLSANGVHRFSLQCHYPHKRERETEQERESCLCHQKDCIQTCLKSLLCHYLSLFLFPPPLALSLRAAMTVSAYDSFHWQCYIPEIHQIEQN